MSGIIAIVGRPNVGKSTLFNRLVGFRQAIVDKISGVTRDRQYGKSEWCGNQFSVIDTGGYVTNSDDIFESEIRKQVNLAIHEANIIFFIVDVYGEITDLDLEIANILRKNNKKVLLVANKVDNNERIADAQIFYKLGLGEVFCISAMSGSGTGELLDETVKFLPKTENEADSSELPKIAIVGRPNAGKSSLLNSLIGEDRHIVTPIAGTTRDSIFTRYNKFGMDFFLIDTAGLRKKGKVTEDLEFYSVMRAVKTIESSDVCLLMLDATRGIEAQDINILRLIDTNNKGLVILVNKWDLVEKDNKTTDEFTKIIKEKIEPFVDVPIIFISAITKQRILKVLETAIEVYNNRKQKITTHKLNEVFLEIISTYPPPAVKGKFVKIKYITQLPTPFPCFAFYCNLPQYIKESYKRFLENKIRSIYNFKGVPITIYFRKK
ncbi:MAG: ribosome biogenesis GTPase Der [Bacteroidetes bacterium CG_4_10_14_3_um_filter_31_20]|nr:ribosome biogenesis GTPase Der [Bacteroidota bacterium]PIX34888.1 MAG: ribosome biogenesis GTPase Der [Bacteroidetes bacterium CG_4_8_14_3_um_filter_31_14]PIY04161.1 MAG: ribosome biogenesis GTPase Der [Bacteroidetes bacterium CG_4_10_14_3_um_filter_31_20]